MSWWKRSLAISLFVAGFATPVMAQIAGHPFEASLGAGLINFDARDRIHDNAAYQGALGWRWTPQISLEGTWVVSLTSLNRPGAPDHTFSWGGGGVRWALRDASGKAVPFLTTGVALGRSFGDYQLLVERGSPELGMGMLLNLFGNPRTYLRLEARDHFFREGDRKEFSNHLTATAGLQVAFGGKKQDSDLDDVPDWLDKCPGTPYRAKVDAMGCPTDSDADSVYDGIDECPGTPSGCQVDEKGCPIDADGDGVCDGIDACPDTPKGATVDAKGCPIDTDGDGVPDGIDQCTSTPAGARVDEKGCPIDSDGDGVPDGIDQCENTPAGLRVDENGCPIQITEKETQLLETGVIRLQDINFESGRATLLPEALPVLDDVGQLLTSYPALQIEIGGHTDNVGSAAYNQKLSEARATSVLTYITEKYPTLDATKFTTRGYGLSKPIASNGTALGKAKNRRVEFKVLNLDQLKIEREKRHFLRKDEGLPGGTAAPADTTGKR